MLSPVQSSAKSALLVHRATPVSSGILSWIVSPGWDLCWFLSGLWLPLLVFLPVDWSEPLLWAVTLCLWIAHRLSSAYLAWCVPEYAAVVKQRLRYFVGLPLLLFVGLALWLLPSEALLPIPRVWRLALVAVIDYFWAIYHFARQHYGVLSIYRSRQRQVSSSKAIVPLLRWDHYVCFAVSGGVSLVMDLHYGAFDPLRVWTGWLSGGLWTGQASLLKGGLSVGVILLWGLTLWRYRQHQHSVPRMLYASSLCVLTLVSLYVPPVLYFVLLQIQHWLVSLGLTQSMTRRSQQVIETPWYRFWSMINARAWGALGVLVLLSLGLTRFLEADAQLLDQLPAMQLQGGLGLYIAATLAFWSAAVHYLYDRGVFRFSDATVRKAAGPLLF